MNFEICMFLYTFEKNLRYQMTMVPLATMPFDQFLRLQNIKKVINMGEKMKTKTFYRERARACESKLTSLKCF